MPDVAQPIPADEWRWFGHAGHLCVAEWCRFHLATQVGDYLVSTVGEYVPSESVREVMAAHRGILLTEQGEARAAEWIRKAGFEEIGYQRTYETMVFRAGSPCQDPTCRCGMPIPADWTELDMEGYRTAGAATAGHRRMCEKWAAQPAGEGSSDGVCDVSGSVGATTHRTTRMSACEPEEDAP